MTSNWGEQITFHLITKCSSTDDFNRMNPSEGYIKETVIILGAVKKIVTEGGKKTSYLCNMPP